MVYGIFDNPDESSLPVFSTGKLYLNRSGDTVEVYDVDEEGELMVRYTGEKAEEYPGYYTVSMYTGRFMMMEETPFDLVKEVTNGSDEGTTES